TQLLLNSVHEPRTTTISRGALQSSVARPLWGHCCCPMSNRARPRMRPRWRLDRRDIMHLLLRQQRHEGGKVAQERPHKAGRWLRTTRWRRAHLQPCDSDRLSSTYYRTTGATRRGPPCPRAQQCIRRGRGALHDQVQHAVDTTGANLEL